MRRGLCTICDQSLSALRRNAYRDLWIMTIGPVLLSLVMVAASTGWGCCGQGVKLCESIALGSYGAGPRGQVCIRPKLMMITLNSAACCFQGRFSTSPSPANSAPGYCSSVESGNSEVLHIFLTFHLLMTARYCRNSHVNSLRLSDA